MPRKPTQPFGYIAFAKSGRVTKHMNKLSEVKEEQELEVVYCFVNAYNRLQLGPPIENVRLLGQNDHDAIAIINSLPLQLQVTELVQRSFTFDMTKEEYDTGKFKKAIFVKDSAIMKRIDSTLRDKALWHVIENKINKSYQKPVVGELWLIVFTTDVLYMTEYVEAGTPAVSAALKYARDNLASHGHGPFAHIWFTNLQTRPVQIWPLNM